MKNDEEMYLAIFQEKTTTLYVSYGTDYEFRRIEDNLINEAT